MSTDYQQLLTMLRADRELVESQLSKIDRVIESITGLVETPTVKQTTKKPRAGKVPKPAPVATGSADERVLQVLKRLGVASPHEIRDAAGLELVDGKQVFERLKREGRIVASGSGRGTTYTLSARAAKEAP